MRKVEYIFAVTYFFKETCEPQFTAFTLDCILVQKTEDQSEAREKSPFWSQWPAFADRTELSPVPDYPLFLQISGISSRT